MSTQQTTIQIRVGENMKKRATEVLQKMGLDLSSSIKLFLNEIITNESLPFTPATKKGKELRHYELYKKEIAWAKKHGKRYDRVEDLHKDLGLE